VLEAVNNVAVNVPSDRAFADTVFVAAVVA
jgi:hypothetical protein